MVDDEYALLSEVPLPCQECIFVVCILVFQLVCPLRSELIPVLPLILFESAV